MTCIIYVGGEMGVHGLIVNMAHRVGTSHMYMYFELLWPQGSNFLKKMSSLFFLL